MRINIVENWNVKSKKDKSRENISIPYAYSIDSGKSVSKKVKFTKQFKINTKKGEEEVSDNRRYILEFEGVATNCTIELNGRDLGTHKGGFMPFAIDITDAGLKFNEKNRLVVYLDSAPSENVLGFSKTNKNLYENFVGIVRDVWLNIIEQECFTKTVNENEYHDNIFIFQEKVVENDKDVYYLCADCQINFVDTPNDMYIVATLADNAKNNISRTKFKYNSAIKQNGFIIKVPVEDAILWTPQYPYLYHLKLELFSKDMATGDPVLVDQRVYKRGIREFSIKDGKFYINDEETRIKGVCHHQVYPIIGMVTSRRAEFREILKLKSAGFNAVRLVNYPASKEFYDACDTLGMIVINSVPNNGQFSNKEEFKNSVRNTFSELSYRDRNHTCVAMWEASIGNITAGAGLTDDLIKECIGIIKRNYTFGAAPLIVGETGSRDAATVAELGYDVAYCTYNDKLKMQQNVEGMPANLIGSFGGDSYRLDKKDKSCAERKMAEQAWAYQFVENQNAVLKNNIGSIIAQAVDYTNGKDKFVMGIMNEYRLPKTAYYYFKSQFVDKSIDSKTQKEKPKYMIYMPHPKLAAELNSMQVYTNCETVKVYIDNTLAGTYPVVPGNTTPYYNPDTQRTDKDDYPDFIKKLMYVGNSANLEHPPVSLGATLKEVGNKTIKIDGLVNGEIESSLTLANTDTPYKLRIFVDYGGIALANDERDFVFVHVALVDEKGNIVCRDGERITLATKGGYVLNYSESKTVCGVSSFMVRAFAGTDKVLLKATSRSKGAVGKEAYARVVVKG